MGDQVVHLGVLYICVANVLPTATAPAADPAVWTSQGSPVGTLPNGLVPYSALTWAEDGTNGFYSAPLTGVSALLTANAEISATLQMITGYAATDVLLASGAWLIAATPSAADGGTLTFFVSNSAVPVGNTKVGISWAIVSY